MQNNGPKPIMIAQKAIILHTFGVQVVSNPKGFRAQIPLIYSIWALKPYYLGPWTLRDLQVEVYRIYRGYRDPGLGLRICRVLGL